MKNFFLFIFTTICMFSFSSCSSSVYGQGAVVYDDSEVVDYSIVVSYGTPYYYNGSVLYYVYDGWYYYPYVLNNRYYYHRYSRPLSYNHYRRYYGGMRYTGSRYIHNRYVNRGNGFGNSRYGGHHNGGIGNRYHNGGIGNRHSGGHGKGFGSKR